MEGWFWRVADAASGRALVALCSINRHPDGDWSTAAVAVHPGDVVHSGALANARPVGECHQWHAPDDGFHEAQGRRDDRGLGAARPQAAL